MEREVQYFKLVGFLLKRKFGYALFFFLFTSIFYGQTKKSIYLDEFLNNLSFIEFKKKKESELFYVDYVETDSLLYKKLRLKEYFGELDKRKKQQLNKLFKSRHNVDSTQIWYIKYEEKANRNFVKSALDSKIVNKIEELEKEGGKIYNIKTKNGLVSNDPGLYDEMFNRDLKLVGNPKNVRLLHFFEGKGFVKPPLDKYFFADRNNIIKNLFNDGIYTYNLIIVFPDGNFYVADDKVSFNRRELFKKRSFLREKKKFKKKYRRSI